MPDTTPSGGQMSPLEQILIVLTVGAAAVGAIVWAGAALAAAVSGHGIVGAGFGDSLGAIPGLVSDPGRPAEAWPETVSELLPGPVIYWLSTVLIAVALIALLVIGRRIWMALSSTRRRLGVDAHARFATKREIRPLMVSGASPGRFIFGTWGGRLLATENRRWAGPDPRGFKWLWARITGELRGGQQGDVTSIAITGPTRCGKTSQCAIPGLLQWNGPAIVLSVKRDLMDITIEQRRSLGEVRVFDPGGFLATSSSHIKVSDTEVGKWSPLRMAHTPSGAKKAGEAMAAWTPQAGVEGGMDFWSTQGKLLFTGLLGSSALSRKPSMKDVAEWVFDMAMPESDTGCPPEEILRAALFNPDSRDAAAAAIRHLNAIWKKPDQKLVASVYATAQTVCDPWLDPNVIAATDIDGDGEWIDLDWLMDTGPEGDKANTLYLLVSLDDYQRLAPVLAGLLSDLKSQAYEWEMRGDRLPAPLLMLIDEAGNMPLDWLPEVSSTCAGIGIQLVTIWQSYAQIHEAYGKRADTLLTNHATKLFFPGASDDSTLGYVSKIVGDEEIERRSWSNDVGSGSGRRSISGQKNNEAMVPYFLARLPEYGSALLIHSNMPPAHIYGREWWRNKALKAMVPSPPPFRSEPGGSGPWLPTKQRRRTSVPTRPEPTQAPAPVPPSPPDSLPFEDSISVSTTPAKPKPVIYDLNDSEVSS
ncbi:MAG: type IV secretory system conjugative DNA transfer family protein [Ilumatobacter sp.]|uniref:type IV secretory system conjugative DNA transfer family protein n=1 Tax=Ilumatobacter sp. TaxID=1967498 RepID=UPI0039198FAD